MSKFEKLVQKILSGSADANINFEDLRNLLLTLKFNERVKGSHHIYFKNRCRGNFQPSASWGEGKTLPGKAGSRDFHQV